jgi:hypothetical protein
LQLLVSVCFLNTIIIAHPTGSEQYMDTETPQENEAEQQCRESLRQRRDDALEALITASIRRDALIAEYQANLLALDTQIDECRKVATAANIVDVVIGMSHLEYGN